MALYAIDLICITPVYINNRGKYSGLGYLFRFGVGYLHATIFIGVSTPLSDEHLLDTQIPLVYNKSH